MTPPTTTATGASAATDTAPRTGRRRTAWISMTALALLTAGVSSRYFLDDPGLFLAQQRAVYVADLAPLLFHISGGVVALAVGPWQFVPRLRREHPAVHRVIGRVYVLGALAAGVGGLLMVPKGLYWPVAPLGFAGLAMALLAATTMAFRAIRRRAFTEHEVWMTRSYALIFAAVTFRLWLAVLPNLGVSFEQAYRSGAWASWPINLLIAQWLISRLRTSRHAARG
ncbi:DUF2306 domain-containing protein [Streptacidiphilus sp. PB12-B1b]|uniref:DUF2306 domain-containing protein n=1 Tax=Streptacidiphilus sp. PB12-B1b TaxID=2705012 RepID=UPI0015FE3C85|nr:DUF2306 domain-containing protein [Streptacidiphilus sp. PB12-B1b]QMU76909.1 DUF2306 domain-containing protein [Streptacidiphilus sp. PB12-B1b]